MNLKAILLRIERRLADLDLSASAASKAAGKPEAIRNLQRAVKDGKRQGISTSTLEALAPVLKTTVSWLMSGVDAPDGYRVRVVGLIGAGGAIDTDWEQLTEPLFEIEIPFPLSGDAIGFQIDGDSMWPKYDSGDVIVVSRAGEPIESLYGQEAAVHVRDGGRFFKRIVQTPVAGLFDLESYNAPPMRGKEINWASGLIARVPASRWRKLNGSAVKAAVRKARKG